MYNINKLLGIFYYNIVQLLRNVIHLPAICFPLLMFHVCIHRLSIRPHQWCRYPVFGRTLDMWRGYTLSSDVIIICFVPWYGGDLLYGMRKIGFLVKDIIVKCLLYLMKYTSNVDYTFLYTVQGFEIERS